MDLSAGALAPADRQGQVSWYRGWRTVSRERVVVYGNGNPSLSTRRRKNCWHAESGTLYFGNPDRHRSPGIGVPHPAGDSQTGSATRGGGQTERHGRRRAGADCTRGRHCPDTPHGVSGTVVVAGAPIRGHIAGGPRGAMASHRRGNAHLKEHNAKKRLE